MKNYINKRIQELEAEWNELHKKFLKETDEEQNDYYHTQLTALQKAIKELKECLKHSND